MIELRGVVLDDGDAAIVDIVEEARVSGDQVRTGGIRADAEEDGVEAGEVASG